MKKSFWQNLPKPFTVLAPMEGVTDFVCRQMIAKIGRPDVFFTEFTSCEGLQSIGRDRVLPNLLFKPNEQPVVAQIWGIKPENFYKTAQDIQKLGFSGIDINMGCPDRAVMKIGAGGSLIKNKSHAAELIQAVKEGAPKLPLSIKTRIGYQTETLADWIGFLLNQKISALSIHLRTVKELSLVPAHWEYMPEILQLRNTISPGTLIIGNGDIVSLHEIDEKFNLYKCEGFMIGRGVIANPWVFNKLKIGEQITIDERFKTYSKHILLFEKTWGNTRNFANLKKFCKAYINNFPKASKYREKIMATKNLEELKKIISEIQKTL